MDSLSYLGYLLRSDDTMLCAVTTLAASAAPAPGLNLALQPNQTEALRRQQPHGQGCDYVLYDSPEKASRAEKTCEKQGNKLWKMTLKRKSTASAA